MLTRVPVAQPWRQQGHVREASSLQGLFVQLSPYSGQPFLLVLMPPVLPPVVSVSKMHVAHGMMLKVWKLPTSNC
jgi:hypothetical protein